jgi:hypothetical protein
MSQEIERRTADIEIEQAPLTEWEIEICAVCRITTEYDRDYGGPFPTTPCRRADCPTSDENNPYATCPDTCDIVVVEKRR